MVKLILLLFLFIAPTDQIIQFKDVTAVEILSIRRPYPVLNLHELRSLILPGSCTGFELEVRQMSIFVCRDEKYEEFFTEMHIF